MKFEKRNFMGIELDVLVGHPEHDLLFLATQVMKAAGLRDPKGVIYVEAKKAEPTGHMVRVGKVATLVVNLATYEFTSRMPRLYDTWLATEANVYKMLLRGHSPQSEPFRKWVTEEVLPTIRKTGKYDAEQSTNPIAVGLMDELKALRGEVGELKALIQGLNLTMAAEPPKSPYEGVTKGTVWYHKDLQAIRKAGETLRMSATVVDRYTPHLLIQLEKTLIAKWRSTDTRVLDSEFSANGGRNWTLWPMNFLKANLMHTHYVDALAVVMNEKMTK